MLLDHAESIDILNEHDEALTIEKIVFFFNPSLVSFNLNSKDFFSHTITLIALTLLYYVHV